MVRLALLAFIVAQAVQAVPAAPDAVSAGVPPAHVRITRCVITKPRPFSHRATGTTIAFVNEGPTLVHRLTFTVTYRSGDQTYERVVDDAGIFAPNTPVQHHYPLYSDVTFAGSTPLACRVTAAT